MFDTPKLLVRLLALLAALALVAAACGNDDADGSEVEGQAIAAGGELLEGVDTSDWPDTLVFAGVPSEEDERIQERYRSIGEVLEIELGIEVEFFQAADYAGVIEALISGRVDIAGLGPFAYVIGVANGAEIEPLGLGIREPGDEPGYYAYLVARADNDEIQSIDDVVGKRVCFVDPASTSGYLFPVASLLEAGIDPDTDITPIMAGAHDASVLSVVNGDCDAGFAYDTMVTTIMVEAGDIEDGDVKVVAESPLIAGAPTVMRSGLPDSLREALLELYAEKMNREHVLELGVCESLDECPQFAEGRTWGYVYRDDAYYDGVRAVCEQTGAEVCDGIN